MTKKEAKKIHNALKPMKAKVDKELAKFRAFAARQFHPFIKKVMDKYPEITAFSWEQYTPSYCDGEDCTFNVGMRKLFVEGRKSGIGFYDLEYEVGGKYVYLQQAAEDIEDFVMSFDETDLEAWFGPSSSVTVTKTGMNIDEDSSLDDN